MTGDLNEKEVQKGGDMCICMADSFCCRVETNTTLSSNYTPIKMYLKIFSVHSSIIYNSQDIEAS